MAIQIFVTQGSGFLANTQRLSKVHFDNVILFFICLGPFELLGHIGLQMVWFKLTGQITTDLCGFIRKAVTSSGFQLNLMQPLFV